MSIEIININSGKNLKRFIEFPNELYKDNKYYVPNLYIAEKWMLSKKNPFLKHSEISLYLAIKNKKVVGRIAAIYNKTHLENYNDNTGFFGFFDSINDTEVAKLLFNAASNWLKSKGLTKMMGPTNLTTNDSCGFLIEGFDIPPMALMPYNYEYYNELCKKCGLEKEMDLFSYYLKSSYITGKYENIINRTSQKLQNSGITIRTLSKKHFDKDIENLQKIYNACNKDNWGFMPLNIEEFKEMANDLTKITKHDLVLIAEKEGEMIGFLVAIPNINQALKYLKNGKLFPFGFFKYLWYKRKINIARILILGVLKGYKERGIDLVMYKKIIDALSKYGIGSAEACYVMENNKQMNSILKKLDGKCIKKFRLYKFEEL